MALKKAISILNSSYKINKLKKLSPAIDAGVILCFVLNCTKELIFTHNERELSPEEEKTYFKLIALRREGVPVHYIIGEKEFMSLIFKVNSNVLIPRPETETLVENVIDYLKVNSTGAENVTLNILDIGTGSGCIAVSLAYYIDNCIVTATDISLEALDIAYLNACLNGVAGKINFIKSDLFEVLGNCKFDVIVSNPPYISSYELKDLQIEIKSYEPIIALNGGPTGLDYYRKIIEKASMFLNKNGLLAFEIGWKQAPLVITFMEEYFSNIKIIKDLAGIERVVMGRLL